MATYPKIYEFPEDEYETPVEKKRHWGDRLSLGTRAYFVTQVARIFVRGERDTVQGYYNAKLIKRVSQEIMAMIEGCGGRFHIKGLDNIRDLQAPTVFACNHMSALENFVLPGLILPFREVSFVIKSSLLNYPVFGGFIRGSFPIAVERKNPREDLQKVLNEGSERLANGYSVLMFPQSTRRDDHPPESFNSLAVKLARKAKVNIMPIAVKTDFWGNGRFLRDFGPLRRHIPIHMKFGKPLEVHGNGRKTHKAVVEYITSNFKRWQSEMS